MDELRIRVVPTPWNNGKLVGQKAPLKLKEIWAIRVRLQVYPPDPANWRCSTLASTASCGPATCSS